MQKVAAYLLRITDHFSNNQLEDINWQMIVKGIPKVVACDGVAIRFYDPGTNKLRIVAFDGLPANYAKKMKEVEMPEIAWAIVRDGGPLIPKDYRVHPAYRSWLSEFEKMGIKKNLVVGIFIEKKFLGFISLVRKADLPFKKFETRIIKIIANTIAKELTRFYHLNIESSLYRFFLRTKKRVGLKQFFDEIVTTVAKCFNVNGAAVFLLDGKFLKPISTVGRVIKQNERSILDIPELIENIDIRNALVLSPERSQILCAPNHQISVTPIALPKDQQGFFILCFRKRNLLTNDDLALLYIWATAISDYLVNIHAVYQIDHEKNEISKLSRSITFALVDAFEIRSPHFKNHSRDVAKYSVNFARILGWDKKRIDQIETAALLHDIGKIGVPDRILNKPAALSDREWKIMKRHPQISIEIISKIKKLKGITRIIKHHHERWDGRGYPDQLSAKRIPAGARILAIVDAYQALISNRPYRPAYPKRQAIKTIKDESGTKFDPELAAVFADNVDKITKLKGR